MLVGDRKGLSFQVTVETSKRGRGSDVETVINEGKRVRLQCEVEKKGGKKWEGLSIKVR